MKKEKKTEEQLEAEAREIFEHDQKLVEEIQRQTQYTADGQPFISIRVEADGKTVINAKEEK